MEKQMQADRERIRQEEELKRQQLKTHQMARMAKNDDAELYLNRFHTQVDDESLTTR